VLTTSWAAGGQQCPTRPGPAALSKGLLAHQLLQATTRHRRQTRRNNTHHNARGHRQPPAQNARSGLAMFARGSGSVWDETRNGGRFRFLKPPAALAAAHRLAGRGYRCGQTGREKREVPIVCSASHFSIFPSPEGLIDQATTGGCRPVCEGAETHPPATRQPGPNRTRPKPAAEPGRTLAHGRRSGAAVLGSCSPCPSAAGFRCPTPLDSAATTGTVLFGAGRELWDCYVTPTGRPSRAAVTRSLLARRPRRRGPRRGETRQHQLLTRSTR
jgi:hypothetical protein